MSIASEITRLVGVRDTIRSKLLDFGIITDSAAKLSACSEAIDGISLVTPSTPATSISVTPTISAPTTAGVVTVSGSATASVKPTMTKGYTKGAGTAGTITAKTSGTKTITTQTAKTWTPTTKNQTLAAGRWLTGAQTIKGDSNLVAANIKSGKSIFGVTGSAALIGEKTITVSGSTVKNKFAYTYSTDEDSEGDSETIEVYYLYVQLTITDIVPHYIYMTVTKVSIGDELDSPRTIILCNGSTFIEGKWIYSSYTPGDLGKMNLWSVSNNVYTIPIGVKDGGEEDFPNFSYATSSYQLNFRIIGALT